MSKCVWIFCLVSKFSVVLESFSRQFQPKLMGVETSSYYFHGFCGKGPLDRREESWSDPMAAGKKPVTLPFIKHWRICKGESCWQLGLFPSAWSYGFVSVCAYTRPFMQVYFWSRELLDTFLCFSTPHLLLLPPPALDALGEVVSRRKMAVETGMLPVLSVCGLLAPGAWCSFCPSSVTSVLW